jgi:hypothetical protein
MEQNLKIINPACFQLTNNIYEMGSNVTGSVCCLLQHKEMQDKFCLITAGHLFTNKKEIHHVNLGILKPAKTVLSNNNVIGKLVFQAMNSNCDFALIKLDHKPDFNLWHKFNNQLYDQNISSPEVVILSYKNNGNIKKAFIVEKNTNIDIPFDNITTNHGYKSFSKIMFIGSTPNKDTCKTVSQGGDSGACVFHEKTGTLIGLLMGGNKKYTFVVPIQHILKKLEYEYKVI